MNIDTVLEEFKTKAQELYGEQLKDIILFGSYARGEATEDSDIDLLVVLEGEITPGLEIDRMIDVITDINLKYDVLLAVIPISEKRYKDGNSPLLINVRRDSRSKKLSKLALAPNQEQALNELRFKLLDEFNVEALILFGSVVRGEADQESDADLLVVTPLPLTRPDRRKITDLVFEVNLRYGTNFSTLVVDHDSWQTGAVSVLPLHDEIMKDGIPL